MWVLGYWFLCNRPLNLKPHGLMPEILLYSFRECLLESRGISVEDIYIDRCLYACDTAIWTQLPEYQMHIRLILSVARYPDVVVGLDMPCICLYIRTGEVSVNKRLADIQDRTHTPPLLHRFQPLPCHPEEHLLTSHSPYLCLGRFEVEHRRQVSAAVTAVGNEVRSLC